MLGPSASSRSQWYGIIGFRERRPQLDSPDVLSMAGFGGTLLKSKDLLRGPTARLLARGAFPAGSTIDGEDFQFAQLRDTGANRVTFESCDFKYAYFQRAYFVDCEFRDCDFTGARFDNSTIRGEKTNLEGCKLDYVAAWRTILPNELVLRNLPGEANVKRLAAQSLRRNAESIGDSDAAKAFAAEEMLATDEHYFKAARGVESYYNLHYPGVLNRVQYGFKYATHHVSGVIWGHGESPLRLLFWSSCALVSLSALLVPAITSIGTKEPFTVDPIGAMGDALFFAAVTFLGLSYDLQPQSLYTRSLTVMLGGLGYFTLGLLVASAYRRLAR